MLKFENRKSWLPVLAGAAVCASLPALLIACSKSEDKKDAAPAGITHGDKKKSASIESLRLSIPGANSVNGVSLKALPEGTYRLREIQFYLQSTQNSSKVETGFKHHFAKASAPAKGDALESAMAGFKSDTQALMLGNAVYLPYAITSNKGAITFDDSHYYSMEVYSNGPSNWHSEGDNSKGAMAIGIPFSLLKQSKPGVYGGKDKNGNQMDAISAVTASELMLMLSMVSPDGSVTLIQMKYDRLALDGNPVRPESYYNPAVDHGAVAPDDRAIGDGDALPSHERREGYEDEDGFHTPDGHIRAGPGRFDP